MSDGTESSPAISQSDLGDFVHRMSLPSLTSLNAPVQENKRLSPGPSGARHHGSNANNSAVSLTSTDLEIPVIRRQPAKAKPSKPKFSLPPPRTSSKRSSRFLGFEGVFNQTASMEHVAKHSASPQTKGQSQTDTPSRRGNAIATELAMVTPVRRM
jgi:hypothetical protein